MKSRRFLAFLALCTIVALACGLLTPRQGRTTQALPSTATRTPSPVSAKPTAAPPTGTSSPTPTSPPTATFTPTVCPGCGEWHALPSEGAPSGRTDPQLFWTGSELIVWGGGDINHTVIPDGGIYNPATQSWRLIPPDGAPELGGTVSVWTGEELIIWGAYRMGSTRALGGRYNPTTMTWRGISTYNAPQGRWGAAVWTGKEMMFWGGYQGGYFLGDGGRYDPAADVWTPISKQNAPSARCCAVLAWTGTEMIVWGGAGKDYVNQTDGARYDPETDQWTPISSAGAPVEIDGHLSFWTGQELLVWGIVDEPGNKHYAGGRYNPTTDRWAPISNESGLEIFGTYDGVWTGEEMIVSGSYWAGNGFLKFQIAGYDPVTDQWRTLPTEGGPNALWEQADVWIGTDLIVWGGRGTTIEEVVNEGFSFRPIPLRP